MQSSSDLFGKRKMTKFIQRSRLELYDLEKDPDEVVNLANDPAHIKVVADLSAQLKEFQQRTGDPWVVKYKYE